MNNIEKDIYIIASVRLTRNFDKALVEVAKAKHMTKSALIRQVLADYLRKVN